MRTIWTSYYGRVGKLPRGQVLVATSRSVPDFYREMWTRDPERFRWDKSLAPTRRTLEEAKADGFDWREAYVRELKEMNLDGAFARMPDGCILLCFERDWKDCHRKLLWEALHAVYGVAGGEWDAPPTLEQLGLGL